MKTNTFIATLLILAVSSPLVARAQMGNSVFSNGTRNVKSPTERASIFGSMFSAHPDRGTNRLAKLYRPQDEPTQPRSPAADPFQSADPFNEPGQQPRSVFQPQTNSPGELTTQRATAPGTTAPGTTAPRNTAPRTTDPFAAPQLTDPSLTDQRITDPRTTDPRTTDPRTTDPRTTEPPTIDPRTTAPRATDPRMTSPRTMAAPPLVTDPRMVSDQPMMNHFEMGSPNMLPPIVQAAPGQSDLFVNPPSQPMMQSSMLPPVVQPSAVQQSCGISDPCGGSTPPIIDGGMMSGSCGDCGTGQNYFDVGMNDVDCGSEPMPQTVIQYFGGGNWLQDEFPGYLTRPDNFDPGYAVGASIGRRISPRARISFEFTLRSNETKPGNVSPIPLLPGGLPAPQTSGDLDVYSGMINFHLDFRQHSRLMPYVGAGIGYARADGDLREIQTIGFHEPDALAYQAIGGVTLSASKSVGFFVEYRFFGTEDFASSNNADAATLVAEDSYFAHGLFGGLRFEF